VRLESGVGPWATSTENDSLQRRPMCLPHARPTHEPRATHPRSWDAGPRAQAAAAPRRRPARTKARSRAAAQKSRGKKPAWPWAAGDARSARRSFANFLPAHPTPSATTRSEGEGIEPSRSHQCPRVSPPSWNGPLAGFVLIELESCDPSRPHSKQANPSTRHQRWKNRLVCKETSGEHTIETDPIKYDLKGQQRELGETHCGARF
jgi:hypothetical protein